MRDQASGLRAKMSEREEYNQVTLVVEAGLYRGVYNTAVLKRTDSSLIVMMPKESGKWVMLPAGTPLTVIPGEQGKPFASGIIGRELAPTPLLELSLPGSIAVFSTGEHRTRVIAISGGKGGVGKTNIAVNLALYLHRQGIKVVLLDADLGLANVDVLTGMTPEYNLVHLIHGERGVKDIISSGPEGLPVIAGGSGITELADLEPWKVQRFIHSLNELADTASVLVVDTAAGIARQVTAFLIAADEMVVVTTPEPTAVTDAYAVIKVAVKAGKRTGISLLVNRVQSRKEADETYHRLSFVARQFLGISVGYAGYVPWDKRVEQAVKNQAPFLLAYPESKAARAVVEIGEWVLSGKRQAGSVKGFFRRLYEFLNRV